MGLSETLWKNLPAVAKNDGNENNKSESTQ